MPANLHILSMLIQNADRTTYEINKIVVFVLAFVVFFVVGFVSWQWDGVAPEPWRLRTLVLTPLTMSNRGRCPLSDQAFSTPTLNAPPAPPPD
ncbi:MAG TPA: hypothetical protein PK077_01225, partial [Akkermansia muciniphila]|nr:hypothetical protein [Akkermansia muciniphila]